MALSHNEVKIGQETPGKGDINNPPFSPSVLDLGSILEAPLANFGFSAVVFCVKVSLLQGRYIRT